MGDVSIDYLMEDQLVSENKEWGRTVIKGEKNISDFLLNKTYSSINSEVKTRADLIFRSMVGQSSRKGTNKIQLIYYCVYNAYLELDIPFSPFKLVDVFGLDMNKVSKCASLFSRVNTGYSPSKNRVKAWYYFEDFCTQSEMTKAALNELIDLYYELVIRDETLVQHKPQSLAAGIFKYYLTLNGITIKDKDHIAKITRLSNATINTVMENVSMIHNS
jgi:hypothetical protein